jgi:hypothetical protein
LFGILIGFSHAHLSTARAPPRTRTGYGQYESYTLGRPSGSRLRDLDGSLAEEKVIDPVEDAIEAGEVAIELGLRHSKASLRYRIAEGANRTAVVDLRPRPPAAGARSSRSRPGRPSAARRCRRSNGPAAGRACAWRRPR